MNNFKPHIGKNVIETLTLGMYEDPRFIYREYIQNSADQIDIAVEDGILNNRDEGIIKIFVDSDIRAITIEDNATGIESDQVRKFLGDIANSEKDISKRKGFRGIGRLGGLGYCEQLVFETSFKGETVKNTMTLNAKLLKGIIENRQDNSDAASVISVITNIEKSNEPINSHFFKVSLLNVTNEMILEVNSVTEYLSMVAPIPFSPNFKYGKKIVKHFRKKNFELDEYKIFLNENQLYKAYKNKLNTKSGERPEITSIGFFDVHYGTSRTLALGWYGISTKVNEVIDKSNPERGIRIRKDNITIGNEKTLFQRFKADRTNQRYIGEIHVIGEEFIPNARRDYFNDNKTLKQFEKALEKIFEDFESKLPHRASDLHNRLKNIINFRVAVEKFKEDRSQFKTEQEDDQRLQEVIDLLSSAEKASLKIEKIKAEANGNAQIRDLFESIVGEYNYVVEDSDLKGLNSKKLYPPLKFSKVNYEQAQILNEVVSFLLDELGYRKANRLINKLQKKYD